MTSAEKKADNKRKRQQSGSLARNAVTAKFIRKLEAKDTLIGQLQALQSSAVMVGSLREQERDTAQAEVADLKKAVSKLQADQERDSMELVMQRRINEIQKDKIASLEADKDLLQKSLQERATSTTVKETEVAELKKDLERLRGRRLEQQGMADRLLEAALLNQKKEHQAEKILFQQIEERSKELCLKFDFAVQESTELKVLNTQLSTQLQDAQQELEALKQELGNATAPTSPAVKDEDDSSVEPMVPTEQASPDDGYGDD
ncbi:hypothetical protein AK812_SmicGene21861 [Symbiodinium microadriaticum]|uniref:Uncharacterized protein n=1 Tax=Symbiodinium microadriaticum TaxID=2951 RepID=A0A1Q9DLC1_SYMMI|nr:hypothetical protein AK812_SmicGene21861 [Symbiodinium microadriaticum]